MGGGGATTSASEGADEAVVDTSIFDPREILGIVGGSNPIMMSLLEKFASNPPQLEPILAAVAAADAETAAKLTHRVKGQLRYLAAHPAVKCAQTLEDEAKAAVRDADWSDALGERLAALAVELRGHTEGVLANVRAAVAVYGGT